MSDLVSFSSCTSLVRYKPLECAYWVLAPSKGQARSTQCRPLLERGGVLTAASSAHRRHHDDP